MNIPLLDLRRQHEPIKKDFEMKLNEIFESSSFIMGNEVNEFEKEFAEYVNAKHAISVGNGTDALVIALRALGVKTGDEVITSSYTFFATAESIAAVGAIPVFVDVLKDTYDIDYSKIEDKITNKTKVILPVHIFGQPANMDKIIDIAKKHNLKVLEDACQAVGSKYNGKMIGSISDITVFSFFPTKNLGCAGDGGMITTDNDDYDTICRAIKIHGSGQMGKNAYQLMNNVVDEDEGPVDKYNNYIIGCNSRLDAIQAALLRLKLKLLPEWTEERRNLAKYYNEQLKDTSFVTPYEADNVNHVYHLYILQSEEREKVEEFLKEKGVATGTYYKIPLHLQHAFDYLNYKEGDLEVSEYLSKRTFAIPLYVGMTREEQDYVISCLKEYDLENGKK